MQEVERSKKHQYAGLGYGKSHIDPVLAPSCGPFTHHNKQPQGWSVSQSRLQTLFTALLHTSQLLASSSSQMNRYHFPNETLNSEERYRASQLGAEKICTSNFLNPCISLSSLCHQVCIFFFSFFLTQLQSRAPQGRNCLSICQEGATNIFGTRQTT